MTTSTRQHNSRATLLWSNVTRLLAGFTFLVLIAVVVTVFINGFPIVYESGIVEFLFGQDWMPIDYGFGMSFGIGNFIAATLYISLLALLIAFVISVGAAMYLSSSSSNLFRDTLYSLIDLLAGVPSVVYGFVGLVIVVKMFIEAGHPSGSCVLAASIVLAVMLLPFMISSFSESMRIVLNRYKKASLGLGVSNWFCMYSIVLPQSMKLLWPSVLLALGRAMGETMAVMMVCGNANLFPTLLGKTETIASLVALEMGTAVSGSEHMHALYAAGFVLLLIVLIFDLVAFFIEKKAKKQVRARLKNTEVKSKDNAGSNLILGAAGAVIMRVWAWLGIIFVVGVIVFLFGYVFYEGSGVISWEFLTESPSGAVLGTEGGIYPAIIGSLWFTGTALLLAAPLAIGTALYRVYFCKNEKISELLGHVMTVLSGAPSIVLGLFAYAVLVKQLGMGRCIFASGVALALMVIPFIEVRIEKALREVPPVMIKNAYTLGCSKSYILRTIVLPACAGEILSALVLGGCFALGATAPLIFTGGVAFAPLPGSWLDPAMALPLHLYLMLAQGNTIPQVYATAFVLMVLVFVVNLVVAIYARSRRKKWMM